MLLMLHWTAQQQVEAIRNPIKMSTTITYCTNCGSKVEFRVPEGDHLPRHVCPACDTIHYSNPKNVVGCIPEWQDRILLCRRAIEPQYGLWTLPAGFMENEESTAEGAARETWEEAHARVEVGDLFTLLDIPHISQVHFFYRARMLDLDYGSGPESLEVALFREEDIPWEELAFASVRQTLKLYFSDRREGRFRFHQDRLAPRPRPAAG